MMGTRADNRARGRRPAPWFMAAVLVCFALCSHAAWCLAASEPLDIALLTSDLGDPRAPGNLKVVLALPPSLASRTPTAMAGDFAVYVYPGGLPDGEGMTPAYRADGVYLWRRGVRIYLDVRVIPVQGLEGPATVTVVYRPRGENLAEGSVQGVSRYADELADVVLAVDVSRSMLYNDPNKRRIAAARAFMDMARKGGGIGRVGLVTFNHRAKVQTPLLPLAEGDTVLKALGRVGAEGLTSLDAPLKLAMRELAKVEAQRPVVILLTDGRNEGSVYKDTHLECAKQGVRLFTVGLAESADHDLLKEMADATGGMYLRAPQDSDLPEIYARLAAELGKRRLLHAEILRGREGTIAVPVDATVRRLVAMADGGARLGASGPAGARLFAGDAFTSVQMGTPSQGAWNFAWRDAQPDHSLLALFGDTGFYLDVFPPQLHGGKLAVGATLADGVRPLPGAEVWVVPVRGLFPEPIPLYDDGLHGDGLPDDGVYGAVVDYAGDSDQFDLVVRARGLAWDRGEFVRQGAGLAIRSYEPVEEWAARMSGDVDFGVLFPGETGLALARLELEASDPRPVLFNLGWDDSAGEWPRLSSRIVAEPGEREYELEMTVPASALPGDYRGVFEVAAGDGDGDSVPARIKVGTVRFRDGEPLDFGDVPPGTFASRTVGIDYVADKPAALDVQLKGPTDELGLSATQPELPMGAGRLTMEVMLKTPIGKPEGWYGGRLLVRAGPGSLEIPLRWRVKALAIQPADVAPVEGLPSLPELAASGKAPSLILDTSDDPWAPASPVHDGDELAVADLFPERRPSTEKPGESPWDRTSELFREPAGETDPELRIGADEIDFPAIAPPKAKDDSFWAAWWIYILAALLLLLLLILLLAYILYRLGKSALARFLAASAIANAILLVIFLALLGTSFTAAARAEPTIAVTLTEDDDYQPHMEFTAAEKEMLDASGLPSELSGAGEASAAGEITFDPAPASGGEFAPERQPAAPSSSREQIRLADAGEVSAVPLERLDPGPMRRRDAKRARDDMPEPIHDMPEMAEPPLAALPVSAERSDASEKRMETGEAGVDVGDLLEAASPSWSEVERAAPPRVGDEEVMLAEAAGMETINLEQTQRRLEPRGQRLTRRFTPVLHPEPRVEIDDPARDVLETAASDRSESLRADSGVEELRIEPRVAAKEYAGEKPGVVRPRGAAVFHDVVPAVASGAPQVENMRTSSSGGAGRMARRGGLRPAARQSSPDGGTPGGLARGTAAGGPERATRARSASRGGGVDERRFDSGTGAAGAPNGLALANGTSRSSTGVASPGASPNPFANGGGVGREAFAGDTVSSNGNGNGGMPRRGRRGDGNMPNGTGVVPGGHDGLSVGKAEAPGAGGASGRFAGNGVGEGRFDDMAPASAGTGGQGVRSVPAASFDGGELAGGEAPGGLDSIPFHASESDWLRNDRRTRTRQMNVAASSVDANSLLIVVGDFARLPDPAAENLFGVLARRMTGGMTVEERRLAPGDVNLADTLLALVTPAEADAWSDDAVRKVARYLHDGGHLWMDARSPEQARPAMERLAAAAAGEFGPLPPGHQLREGGGVDALSLDGEPVAVVTYQDWRRDWRYGTATNGPAFRFLIRSLNYFLSGNAEYGIVLQNELETDDVLVQPSSTRMPEILAGGPEKPGRVWDDFSGAAVGGWRMPSWSDSGRISIVSDGEGGRAMKLDLDGAVKGRVAVYRALNPPQDFSLADRVSLDFYYDGQGGASASLVLTVPGSSGWSDYESRAVPLAHGWNRVVFPLGGGDFRALADGGGFDRVVPEDDRVGRVGFFIYREADSTAVTMMRDVRLHDD